MDKIKVAIVGTGTISNEHIAAYQSNPNVDLYAFCDLDEAKVKMMGEKYGVTRLYTDEETMLKELPEEKAKDAPKAVSGEKDKEKVRK